MMISDGRKLQNVIKGCNGIYNPHLFLVWNPEAMAQEKPIMAKVKAISTIETEAI